MKCPLPILDRRFLDEDENAFEPVWRPCGGDIYVMTDRGAGTPESPLDWYMETWKVECEMGHVLLLPYDDTNGPVVRLEEASEPKNWIAIGIDGLRTHLLSLEQKAFEERMSDDDDE